MAMPGPRAGRRRRRRPAATGARPALCVECAARRRKLMSAPAGWRARRPGARLLMRAPWRGRAQRAPLPLHTTSHDRGPPAAALQNQTTPARPPGQQGSRAAGPCARSTYPTAAPSPPQPPSRARRAGGALATPLHNTRRAPQWRQHPPGATSHTPGPPCPRLPRPLRSAPGATCDLVPALCRPIPRLPYTRAPPLGAAGRRGARRGRAPGAPPACPPAPRPTWPVVSL
jgi:hypothetical protein